MALSRIYARAKRLGFEGPYIVDLDSFGDEAERGLREFIDKGHHGSMSWIKETLARRGHPKHMWPEARSALVFGLNYGPEADPLESLKYPEHAAISVYARNRDYHDVIKGRLKELAGIIARDLDSQVKVFVDTAPLMEKPLAQAGGLGWQGKHTNLVNQDYGSWLFLGVILTDAKLPATPPETDHCGSCRACLDICPTNAFPEPYKIDARKCISYLTIEHKGPIDPALRPKLGNRIYGCDDCLAICPWNKFAKSASEIKLQAREDLTKPRLADLVSLDDTGFRAKFSGSPIKRIGRDRFVRNVLYAIGNSGSPALSESAKPHIKDEDAGVKDAAIWAIEQLSKVKS
jgi:epoxyqueuosine reductase